VQFAWKNSMREKFCDSCQSALICITLSVLIDGSLQNHRSARSVNKIAHHLKSQKKRQKVTQLQSRLSALYSTSNSSTYTGNSEAYVSQRNSTFGRILGMFGYGDSVESNQNSHTRPQGSDPFAIQQLSPVVVRPVNIDRVV